MEFMVEKNGVGLPQVIDALKALSPNRRWRIEIVQHRRNRSRAQNALYWMWLSLIGGELGYTKDEMHYVMAMKFLGGDTLTVAGEEIVAPRSTTILKTDAFANYLNQIEFFATSELGIRLPRPDDLYWEALFNDPRARG